jgi:PTS system cellobiose-specific IIB component
MLFREWKMAEKKIKVVLVCAAGMSSSLIEEKIKQAAAAAGKDMELKAIDATRMALWDYDCDRMDIILVAPQVRFKKKSILEKAEPLGIIVQDIDTIAYGMVDGEKIFGQVVEALNLD